MGRGSTRRMSPRLLREFLGIPGGGLLWSLEAMGMGAPPWRHQQQIGDATGPPLYDRTFLSPVLDTELQLPPQLTAFFTSAPILTSSPAVNSFSAKATGHTVPSSRFALSVKPNVAYLALNLCALWKKQTILPSLA